MMFFMVLQGCEKMKNIKCRKYPLATEVDANFSGTWTTSMGGNECSWSRFVINTDETSSYVYNDPGPSINLEGHAYVQDGKLIIGCEDGSFTIDQLPTFDPDTSVSSSACDWGKKTAYTWVMWIDGDMYYR